MKPQPAVLLLLWAATATAQQPPIISAEVHPDRTITFRLPAPQASAVTVTLSGLSGSAKPGVMQKNDEGVWSATLGPLDPEIYSYSFSVDGVRILDPSNPNVKPGVRVAVSLVEVPAAQPSFYDLQPVPHGTVHMNLYESKSLGMTRPMYVYTPPGYESEKRDYPVLYLLHGSGDTESGWVAAGRANVILDNLIAARKAVPMIVVMPFGHPQPAIGFGNIDPAVSDRAAFTRDLLEGIMPFAEKLYRISAKPESRAIAGLSMGGSQSIHIGLNHLELFRSIGIFSSGIARTGENDQSFPDLFADPPASNKKIKILWIGIGRQDPGFPSAGQLTALLKKHGIEHEFHPSTGAHAWPVWRGYLNEFVPRLFQ